MDNPKKLRIVASFTTLPDRYSLVQKSINSMRNQDMPLDAIYLTVPMKSHRLNKEYPTIPDELLDICTVIRTDIDYGPITKIYGALISEKDPETIIISIDDDVIHKNNFVRKLVEHLQENPGICICGTGALLGKGLLFISMITSLAPFRSWNGLIGPKITKKGRCVDLIFGVAGVLYQRGHFPDQDNLHNELFKYSLENENIFLNDDVLISGYLSKKGIKRMVFYDIPDVKCQDDNREDALSFNLFSMIAKLNRSIKYVKEQGFFQETESVAYDETALVKIIFILIIIVLIIILCVFFYKFIEAL